MVSFLPEILEPCASCGARCCNRFAVCVTSFDVVRVADATGMAPGEFVAVQEASLVSYRSDPTLFLFDENGEMKEHLLVLKREKTNYCVFSKHSKGCVAYLNRPMVCRSYPFVSDGNKGLKQVKNPVCWRKWREDEAKWEEFLPVFEKHMKELFEYGKIARRWNAERAKKGNFEECLSFVMEESRKVKIGD